MSATMPATIQSLVNNLDSFKTEALIPVFEAVINSIQAIEETGSLKDKRVIVRILRDPQTTFHKTINSDELPKIIGFAIEDNGIGFTDKCFEAFENYGTEYKLQKGGKGIGRFTWLKAFDRVDVSSIYFENNETSFKREFEFTLANGVNHIQKSKYDTKENKTIVKLSGFKKDYQEQPSAYKRVSTIAQRILEHSLSCFIANEAPEILIIDESGEESSVNLTELFTHIKDHIITETIKINSILFTLHHIKLFASHRKAHNFVYCANNRDVITESIDKHIGSDMLFDDSDQKFIYSAYISSDYLDEHVEPSRLSFRIPEEENLYKDEYPVSMSELRNNIIIHSKKILENYLSCIMERKNQKLSSFVTNNPWFKGVLHYCEEVFNEIELNSSEEKMQETFYKYKGKAELAIIKQHSKLLKTQPKNFEEMEDDYNSAKDKIEILGKDTLSEYVLYRKMIIELLDKKLKLNKKGKYYNENIVHDIFFPRYSTTDKIRFEDHNLWLLDERLAFHNYAKSEQELKNDEGNLERADIVVFSQIDSSDRIASAVSIIEFKKPQRKDFDENPTKQVYRYVRLIRENNTILPDGRDLRVDERTRFYCYVICDINKKIEIFAEDTGFAKLKGELGYYDYNKNLNTHTEIINFDKIVIDAEMRHKAFFEKLGIKCFS